MPDRVVRASILSSNKVNRLSWPAEIFYRRLMSIADDFGRHEADISLLRAYLYPKKLDKVSEPDVVKWMSECSEAGLVRQYSVDGSQYLQIEDFNQRLRAMRSKYPEPPPSSADICQQPPAADSSRRHPLSDAARNETKRNESETNIRGAPSAPRGPEDGKPVGRKIFKPPTVQEVVVYFLQTIGAPDHPKHWPEDKCRNQAALLVDHYTANGWVQGRGKPIKDWQAAARNWIRHELQGIFKPPEKPKPEEKPAARASEPLPKLSKLQEEINALFKIWCENPEHVTVISVSADHYNFLKSARMIAFSEQEAADIKRQAVTHMQKNQLEGSNFEIRLMKAFGVLEFFKQQKTLGKETIFVP